MISPHARSAVGNFDFWPQVMVPEKVLESTFSLGQSLGEKSEFRARSGALKQEPFLQMQKSEKPCSRPLHLSGFGRRRAQTFQPARPSTASESRAKGNETRR